MVSLILLTDFCLLTEFQTGLAPPLPRGRYAPSTSNHGEQFADPASRRQPSQVKQFIRALNEKQSHLGRLHALDQ